MNRSAWSLSRDARPSCGRHGGGGGWQDNREGGGGGRKELDTAHQRLPLQSPGLAYSSLE